MAYLDSSDLLSRLRRLLELQVPAEYPRDPDLYAWLTEAQDYWVRIIAQHACRLVAGAPVAIPTTDSGYTYVFPTVPVAVESVTIGRDGTPLRIGAAFDPTVDASWEGESTLRITRNRAQTFSQGLYARYVAQPSVISDESEPSLPTQCRLLLPPRAAVIYARSGGSRNPAPYLDEETRLWSGDPTVPGDVGILGAIKKKQFTQSVGGANGLIWWRTSDLGR